MIVITILEAKVSTDQAGLLQDAFEQAVTQLDAGIVETFLLQSPQDRTLWRIFTAWESREALTAMRQSGETPRGILMFRAAGAEPSLSIFEVIAQGAA